MKILLPLILFFAFSFLHAGESKALTVKYDEKYYSPCGRVEKFDIVLPQKPKQKNYFIRINFKNHRGNLFGKTFVTSQNISIYCYRPWHHQNGNQFQFSVVIGKKQLYSHGTSFQRLPYVYIMKQTIIKPGGEAAVVEYTNIKRKENNNSNILYRVTLCSPPLPKKKYKYSYKLSIRFEKKQENNDYISLTEAPSITPKIKLPDLNKLTKEELIKLRDKIMQAREKGLQELAEDRGDMQNMIKLTQDYHNVGSFIEKKYKDRK